MSGRIRSTLVWALALPLIALAGAFAACQRPVALLVPLGVLVLYGLQVLRITVRQQRTGQTTRNALRYGFFTLVAKWAHLAGCLRYWAGR